jgi:amidophosphoribosyltransferase
LDVTGFNDSIWGPTKSVTEFFAAAFTLAKTTSIHGSEIRCPPLSITIANECPEVTNDSQRPGGLYHKEKCFFVGSIRSDMADCFHTKAHQRRRINEGAKQTPFPVSIFSDHQRTGLSLRSFLIVVFIDMCGVFGIIGHPEAKAFFPTVLASLQHRGHDAAGMAGCVAEHPNWLETVKGIGKVATVITPAAMEKFTGNAFIGHTRYSTRNTATSVREIHPHWAQSMLGKMAIVTNGDLINVDDLLRQIEQQKVKVYTNNDAEIMAALINIQIRRNGKKIFQAVKETMRQIRGGYAALLMMEDDDRIFAFRDPWGIRPLHMSEFVINGQKCVAFASETCAFDIIQRYNYAKYPDHKVAYTHRELRPGEIIAADALSNLESTLFKESTIDRIGCVFETIYFSRPDSRQRGQSFQVLREQMGLELYRESPVEADLVTSVPKGGIPSAVGYARAAQLPYSVAILEEPTTGGLRSFTTNPSERLALATMKYNILPDVVANQRLIVIDDSIVRGTTTKLLVKNLFLAGAREVHLRIPCPPYNFPCHYGIETRDPETLISHHRTVDEICRIIGATSLAYLSLGGLYRAIGQDRSLFCDECLSARSPFSNDAA